MKISYSWLKEYVCFDLSPKMLADKLTGAGLVAASIEPFDDDYCIDLEVTANRADCMGIIGIAREVAAITKGKLQLPCTDIYREGDRDISQNVKVEVEEPLLCSQYTARVIRNIMVKPSPEWLQKRLKCIGLRPVNNIVDITNYVMMESGQPLHAFDLDKVSGGQIQVRKAKSGEEIVAINGARRVLFHDMLIIADEKRPIAIAGVMGGKETEVTDATRNILIECARFEPRQVRRTSKALGIVSDSSCRFERGVDPLGLDFASKRAAKLIIEHAGGEMCKGIIDVSANRIEAKKVVLRIERVKKILGVEINRDVILDILRSLQFKILNCADDTFIDVEIPCFRSDVSREIDLIEEVSRVYDYNNIPAKTSIGIRGSKKSKYEIVENLIRNNLTGLGFYETKTFSIVNHAFLKGVNLWSGEDVVEIANPLRQEESILRTSLLPSLAKVKIHNANHGCEKVKLFEIAKIYLKGEKLPHEKVCLSLLDSAGFFEGKGIVQSLLKNLEIHEKCEWVTFHEKTRLFNNEKAAKILMDGKTLGYIGEASKESGFKTLCTLIELDVDALVEKAHFDKKYCEPSPYPMIKRDFAIVVDEEKTWASIEDCVNGAKISIVKEVNYFDIYRGKQIPEGKKSIAFNLCFQSHERTLKSEEVDNASEVILDALYKKLGAELRRQ